jgi:hypothetical protein
VGKTPRLTLTYDEQEEFDIIGICSGLSDFRLAWNLNKSFSWQLEHALQPIEVPKRKGKEICQYTYYQFIGIEEVTNVYLVKNKQDSIPLLEDYPQLDYVLIIKNNLVLDLDELLSALRDHQQIIAAYRYASRDFSVSEYLHFEQSYE